MKKGLSRRELEDLKRKEDEKAAAEVFQDFLETFQGKSSESKMSSKMWIKAGTYDAGSRKEDTQGKGTIYKPKSKFEPENDKEVLTKIFTPEQKIERLGKRKERERKSNLELFKEELKQMQEERDSSKKIGDKVGATKLASFELDFLSDPNSVESCNDPNTTNIYLGAVSPKVTESHLMEVFGKFGPLASVKIMWPRTEEERLRNRNCGFVAFMCRKDAERALKTLNGKTILGFEMRLGWGKSIVVPSHPVYIPPSLLDMFKPPAPSGLPFNAQVIDSDPPTEMIVPNWQNDEEEEQFLMNTVVKVWIPTDRKLIMLIHRVIEFVIREGPLFEALLMNREIMNPMYQFLFDNKSSAHIYYRWKLFSLLQGDNQKEWKLKEFRMFKNGSIWKPPPYNKYTDGMPDDLIDEVIDAINTEYELQRILMQTSDRDHLEYLIRHLTLDRLKIAEAMIFCIEHSDWHEEITECLSEALTNKSTHLPRKVARLYLVSDILQNCDTKIYTAYYYRGSFEKYLSDVFTSFNEALLNVDKSIAEELKKRVDKVLLSWESSLIYPKDFINNMFKIFYEGTDYTYECKDVKTTKKDISSGSNRDSGSNNSSDMECSQPEKSLTPPLLPPPPPPPILQKTKSEPDEDIDGVPIDLNECYGKSIDQLFTKSKWETIDPEEVEAQAVTTSKWGSIFDNRSVTNEEEQHAQDEKNKKFRESERRQLREIEIKTMQYQDDLESGKRSLKRGYNLVEQVEDYRQKLLRKMTK